MHISDVIAALKSYVKLWFHKRNIIIVSEHKVKHIPLSGKMQFAGLMLVVTCIFWASYSTGRFMATRHALEEQTDTLRSLAGATIESDKMSAASTVSQGDPTAFDLAANEQKQLAGVASLDNIQLVARVAYLEKQITELKTANADIVERVRVKTSGHIDELEAIIKQTGLSPVELKKNTGKSKQARGGKSEKLEGGPYIPDTAYIPSESENELFSDLDELASLRPIVSALPLASPIEDGEFQSGFGRRIDPFNGRLAFHSGMDISGPSGTKILCTTDGKVKFTGHRSAYGNMIDIDHGANIVTRYGHLSQILVKAGQVVHKGDVIGIQGSTGRSTGAHLHYEVRYRDQALNPRNFLEAGRYVSQE